MKMVKEDLLTGCRREIELAFGRATVRARKFGSKDESIQAVEAREHANRLKELYAALSVICTPPEKVPNYRPWGACPKGLEVAMAKILRAARSHPKHPVRGLSERQWVVVCNTVSKVLEEMLKDYSPRLFQERVGLIAEASGR